MDYDNLIQEIEKNGTIINLSVADDCIDDLQ